MSKIDQCARCRHRFDTCGHYDHTVDTACDCYAKPIDNSRMFARWYMFSGRIGRKEYALTLLIAVALYLFILKGAGMLMALAGINIETETELYVLSIGCMIPSIYLAIAAGVKRTHDTRVSTWYSLVPLIPLFFLNVITLVIFCAGCVFLFKDAGEEGVNEHGSNPTQPYEEQLSLD